MCFMNNSYNDTQIIMAGGIESRFWPMSTPDYPKQFIYVMGVGKSLIQLTVDRLHQNAQIGKECLYECKNCVFHTANESKAFVPRFEWVLSLQTNKDNCSFVNRRGDLKK